MHPITDVMTTQEQILQQQRLQKQGIDPRITSAGDTDPLMTSVAPHAVLHAPQQRRTENATAAIEAVSPND